MTPFPVGSIEGNTRLLKRELDGHFIFLAA